MNDIFIRLVSLPQSVHGFVMEDPAGDYNVYIREQDPEELQLRTIDHELQHIVLGHLRDHARPVSAMEAEISPKTADLSGLYIVPR